MKFQNQIDIQRSAREVFVFVAEMRNVPRWNYFVVEVVQETGSGPEEGATYFQTRKSDSQRFSFTQYEQDRSLTVETLPGSRPSFTRHMVLEPTGSGTRLHDQWTLQTPLPGFLEKMALGRVGDAVAENLGKLKELLETGQTQLQDGRISSLG
jgi:hypothetical protein